MALVPVWPYRMASNPFAAPKSEAQLAAFENASPGRPKAVAYGLKPRKALRPVGCSGPALSAAER
jgi:hypothetical protein